jgi:hypothetical protein
MGSRRPRPQEKHSTVRSGSPKRHLSARRTTSDEPQSAQGLAAAKQQSAVRRRGALPASWRFEAFVSGFLLSISISSSLSTLASIGNRRSNENAWKAFRLHEKLQKNRPNQPPLDVGCTHCASTRIYLRKSYHSEVRLTEAI